MAQADISSTTGAPFYSGSWEDIRTICRSLNIGEGKIAKIGQETVNFFQESADREIDAQLTNLYITPLIQFNQYMPDGSTKALYPGEIVGLARYFAAGLLMASEFQGVAENAQEQSEKYLAVAKKSLYDITRFNHRLQGQIYISTLRMMPPTWQPPVPPEYNG